MFCFHSHNDSPGVSTRMNGTTVSVLQECAYRGRQFFQRRSQPLVLGRFPAGNVLFSFSELMAEAFISQILLVMKDFGLSVLAQKQKHYVLINKSVYLQ